MKKRVVIIGAGVGSLATACILSRQGYAVTIYEKNAKAGGRAGTFKAKGFKFDTGPSWYLMPDVFEKYFKSIGQDVNKLLKLKRLDPSYRVFFKDTLLGAIDITGDVRRDGTTLEAIEPGARNKLREYLDKASFQYKLAMKEFLYRNYDKRSDFMNFSTFRRGYKMNVFTSMQNYVSKSFSSAEVQKIMLYPLVFLGSSPKNAPAFYSLMSHIDFKQGVFYPQGGIYQLIEVLVKIAREQGTKIVLRSPVESIQVVDGKATGIVLANGKTIEADYVISNAGLPHTELKLLEAKNRSYSKRYWEKRMLAPSALLIYLGTKRKYPNLKHHNLVFSHDWEANFNAIYKTKKWPQDPSFYVCCPSKTDKSVAPTGKDNLFVLVPLPATTNYSEDDLSLYTDKILETMERTMNLPDLRKQIMYKKVVSAKDFESELNAYHGTALGLAHTLKQTAVFRPNNISKKVSNLFYVGADTVPGIGLPMCLISAQLVAERIKNQP